MTSNSKRKCSKSARSLASPLSKLAFSQIARDELFADRRLIQTAQISVGEDGNCVTACIPTNEQLLAEAAKHDREPLFVTRYLDFQSSIPDEYAWLRANPIERGYRTVEQNLIYPDWLKVIEHEARTGTGHLGPVLKIILGE